MPNTIHPNWEHRRISDASAGEHPNSLPRFHALAVSLARPVTGGWLSLAVAGALILAADHHPNDHDLLDVWRGPHETLRRRVAEVGNVAS
jgi:hypothetical protein